MAEHQLLSILHLSDLHFSRRKAREIDIVVRALLDDVRKNCIGYRKPDVIIFSGDLVQGIDDDNPDEAYDAFIAPVLQAAGCSEERFILAPGNHDASRKAVNNHSAWHREWRETASKGNDLELLNREYGLDEFSIAIQSKFQAIEGLGSYLRQGTGRSEVHRNHFGTIEFIEALNLQVVLLNTAALTTCGLEGYGPDNNLLGLAEYALIDLERNLVPGARTLSVAHHPLSYLTEKSSKLLDNFLSKNANFHFFGHMHDPSPKNLIGLKGRYLANQCGAIFTSRNERYIGYSLVISDQTFENVEILMRSYFPERSQFDEATDIIEGGRWWPSPTSKSFFERVAEPLDEESFVTHLTLKAYVDLLNRENGPGGFHENHMRFVPPPLKRNFIQEKSGDEGRVRASEPVQYDELVLGESNVIVYARPEYGRTTLLKKLRYDVLFHASKALLPRLPALIEFDEIRSNSDVVLRKVRGGAEALPGQTTLESLLQAGRVCILVDDVKFTDRERMHALREFVTKFPKCRFIFSSSYNSAIQFGASVDPEMPVGFEFVELEEFSRREMRALLLKEERCTDVEGWLDRLQDEFREINLPFTAANGTILIEILAEKYNFNPINRSVLMEQFVDTILSKASVEQSRRETFDYTNKTDLLSYVAAFMARNDRYVVSMPELLGIGKSYVDDRGLTVELSRVFDTFFHARLFIKKRDDEISFRYRGVLEYFIAHRMAVDAEFRDWILEGDRYLRFVNEIGFYAGKLRNDQNLLSTVLNRHQILFDELDEVVGGLDFSDFERFSLPNEKAGAPDGLDDLARSVQSRPLTGEEKDAVLETSLPKDAEDRQEVFRPDLRNTSDKLWLSLILLSSVVKNLELIPDASKRSALRVLWKGWSTFLHLAITVAPRLAKERKVRVNGALYEMQAPHGMRDSEPDPKLS